MANSFKWNPDCIKDEIGTTYKLLADRGAKMETDTITAYVSLLYNLVSYVNDPIFKRDWYSRLLQLKERYGTTAYMY